MIHIIAVPHTKSVEHWRIPCKEWLRHLTAYLHGNDEADAGLHDLSSYYTIHYQNDIDTLREFAGISKPHQWIEILSMLDEIEKEIR